MRLHAAAACAIAGLSAIAGAQQTLAGANARHGDIRTGKDGLVLPVGEFTCIELVEATAAFLCRNYLYDYATLERAGTFHLQRSLALDALGSEELLYALLSSRDLMITPVDELRGVYGITSLDPDQPRRGSATPIAAPAPWRTPETILRRPQLREIAHSHVVLHNVDARQVAQMLAQLHSRTPWRPGHLLVSAGGPDLVMLHGYRDQIAGAIHLARHLDHIARPRQDQSLLDRIAELEQRIRALEAAK